MEAPSERDPPHVIRLRGPWELRTGDSDAWRRIMPPYDLASQLPRDWTGEVLLRRCFGAPPLDTDERVSLAWTMVSAKEVRLNGDSLASGRYEVSVDVTSRLLDRNELIVVLRRSDARGPWPSLGEGARLEISDDTR